MSSVHTFLPLERRHAILPSILGLVIALCGLPIWQWFIGPAVEPLFAPVTFVLLGQGLLWLLAFGVLAVTVYWECQPLASVGIRSLSRRLCVLGIGLGIVLSLAVPLFGAIANHMLQPSSGGTIQSTSVRAPAWVMSIVILTAVVTEELLFRAYPFERLARLTGSSWLAAFVSLSGFVVVHLGGWNMAHVWGAVLPIGAIMTALYAWQRNLMLNILVHFVINLPIALIAAGILPPL